MCFLGTSAAIFYQEALDILENRIILLHYFPINRNALGYYSSMDGSYYWGKALVYKSNKIVSSPGCSFFFLFNITCPRLCYLHDIKVVLCVIVSPRDLLKNEMYIS